MANFELHLISKVLKAKNADQLWNEVMEELGFSNRFLMYPAEFEFIIKHQAKYGLVPSIEVFEKKFPQVSFPKANDPLKYYLDEIKDAFLFSEMSDLHVQLTEKLQGNLPREAYQLSVSYLNKMEGMKSVTTDLNLVDSVDERLKSYEERLKLGLISGIPTGWVALDQETTGFHKGELVFLTGRMATFKTWILLSWALHAWSQGYVPLLFSREMGSFQIARRIDSLITGTRFKTLKTGSLGKKEFKKFSQDLKSSFHNKHPFYVIDSAGIQTYDTNFIQMKVHEYKPDVVYIDGVYLLRGEGKDLWDKQVSITRDLKAITLGENIPLIGTTQANRGVGKKARVKLENVAYSDSYGQDADYVIALNRAWDSMLDRPKDEILVEMIKGRDAEPIKTMVAIDLNQMRIMEGMLSIEGGSQDVDIQLEEHAEEEEFNETLLL